MLGSIKIIEGVFPLFYEATIKVINPEILISLYKDVKHNVLDNTYDYMDVVTIKMELK